MSQSTNGKVKEAMLETDVMEKAKRRQNSAEYKQRILWEAETNRATGEIGALLRREGSYSSNLIMWQCGKRVDPHKIFGA
jgi:hypothetical protein